MPIEGFDYKNFANELATQAGELIPKDFQNFQREYVINTIKNFATLSGEAIYNDEKTKFTADQGMLITQIIAEWSFHKSIDIIKVGILPDYWDGIMQKLAFTIFEVAKQAILKGVAQDEVLKIVEHHVKKTYEKIILELKERNVIDDSMTDRAMNQSNIDDMMKQLQQERDVQGQANQPSVAPVQNDETKILKLASVAMLLKQLPQDKIQTILNKFNPNDAQTVIQYMQMRDLDTKIDQDITIKCLQEIRTNLPAAKYVSPDKILSRMNKVFEKMPKEGIDRIVTKERPNVKEFITKASEGEYLQLPSKVANIIAQHLEESIS